MSPLVPSPPDGEGTMVRPRTRMGEGFARQHTPHPSSRMAAQSCPLPQGERAQSRRPRPWIRASAGMSGGVEAAFKARVASLLWKVHHPLLARRRSGSMHDIVIRGGTIIDGTGKAAFTGDVAIAGQRISQVGGKLGPARREIDATGLLVTPGWVDVHTHYDGQAMWDPLLGPSCWHGVTTAMFGNCGVGFAPVRPQHRAALMELMEGVEEIPGVV